MHRMFPTPRITLSLLAVLCISCSPSAGKDPKDADTAEALPVELVAERPAAVFYPSDYDASKKYPLVIALHGYGASGHANDLIFGLAERIDSEQFILVQPDGTRDKDGRRYWNATPECCMFDDLPPVDDVGYVTQLIDAAQAAFNIDPDRVALVGHSNGGYMSYRYACEKPERINRIAVLAGSVVLSDANCPASSSTTLLHVHGTLDDVIRYYPYPSDLTPTETDGVHTVGAEETVRRWRSRDGCTDAVSARSTLDVSVSLPGAETQVSTWTDCDAGRSVTLWKVVDGDHLFLDVTETFQDALAAYLVKP